jgi:predicted dehydrogenase
VRAFSRIDGAELVAVCDPDAKTLDRASKLVPRASRVTELPRLLDNPGVDAVVLATPAVLHAEQAAAALSAGKHVFVEKPMALAPKDADALVKLAVAQKRTLMVGHLMLYHPGYRKLRELVASGEIGELLYLYSLRVNLGRIRRDENALWSFAPHDLSMILDLVGAMPTSVAARGESYLQPGIEDVVFVNLAFPNRRMAQIQLSWLDPRKERRLTVVGSRKMVEFDDVHPTEKLKIYDKGYDRPPAFTQYGEYLTVRQGDIHIPHVDMSEPLDIEARHFVTCVQERATPLTDAVHGAQIVHVLDAAQRSLASGGSPVKLDS